MMKKSVKALSLFLAVLTLCALFTGCDSNSEKTASLSDVSEDCYSLSWWLSKTKKTKTVLADEEAISDLNETIQSQTKAGMADLSSCPKSMTRSQVKRLMKAFKLPDDTLYDDSGEAFDDSFLEELELTLNLEEAEDNISVRYGVVCQDTQLRAYPILSSIHASRDSDSPDLLAGDRVTVGTPVAVLHSDAEETWYFVLTAYSQGWIAADAVGLTKRSTWEGCIASKDNLIVTGLSVTSESGSSYGAYEQILSMGTSLPLCDEDEIEEMVSGRSSAGCYVVKYPVRDRFGELSFTALLIPYSADVSKSTLTLSRRNLLSQAMKLAGHGTSVVGDNGAIMLQMLYSVFGIHLPGSLTVLQSLELTDTAMEDSASTQRNDALKDAECGTIVLTEEGAGIVLGTVSKQTYLLMVLQDYYEDKDWIPVNAAVVTLTDLENRHGDTLSEQITALKSLILPKKEEETTSVSTTAEADISSDKSDEDKSDKSSGSNNDESSTDEEDESDEDTSSEGTGKVTTTSVKDNASKEGADESVDESNEKSESKD